jgi:hypothetical protein
MNFLKIFYKILFRIANKFGIACYFSADGEDVILTKYLSGVKNGLYLDIGCNLPITYSNSFQFYLLGWRGICIDPLPGLKKKFKYLRSKDLFINAGVVADKKKELRNFYFYPNSPDNSTFNSQRVKKLSKLFNRVNKFILKVPTITVKDLLSLFEDNFGGGGGAN